MSNQSAAAFDALGDPMRRRLVELLADGPRPVGALAAQLPIGRPAVSKHLKVLSGAGLVAHRPIGTRNLYLLAPEGVAPLQQWLVAQWDSALTAFAAFVSAQAAQATGGPPGGSDHPGPRTAEGDTDGAAADPS
jgi:DNA-binding transcriptional ArsR family regulator